MKYRHFQIDKRWADWQPTDLPCKKCLKNIFMLRRNDAACNPISKGRSGVQQRGKWFAKHKRSVFNVLVFLIFYKLFKTFLGSNVSKMAEGRRRGPNLHSPPSPPPPPCYQFNNPSWVKTALLELWNPHERWYHPAGTQKGRERSFQLLFNGERPAQCKRKRAS